MTVGGLLVIEGCRVFDGVSSQLVDGPVVIVGGLIESVGGTPELPPGARLIRASGCTVLPGLIDAHFHAFASDLDVAEIERSPRSFVSLAAGARLRAALRRGFTTVRDVAGGDVGVVRAIEAGHLEGPTYYFTGAALSQTGGHGDIRGPGEDLSPCSGHLIEVVDGVENIRRVVRDRLRNGAHAIKVMASGGVVSTHDPLLSPQYSLREMQAAVVEAGRHGSYVAAHAYSAAAIDHALTAGVRTIEHGNLLDAPTASVMAERRAFLVPTLIAYDAMARRGDDLGLSMAAQDKNSEVLEHGARAVELATQAGVAVGWGSDLMGSLEDEQLAGIQLQGEVMGAPEALVAATSTNADILGRPDLGRVQPGAAADLLIVEGDPLSDLRAVTDPTRSRSVIRGGALVLTDLVGVE